MNGGISNAPSSPPVSSVEIYNPLASAWSLTSSMSTPRAGHAGTLLSDGRVLVAGGFDATFLAVQSAEMLTVSPSPAITSISPTFGSIGSSVTITGTGFGPTQGSSSVKFNGTAATSITSWTATSIVALVPVGATTETSSSPPMWQATALHLPSRRHRRLPRFLRCSDPSAAPSPLPARALAQLKDRAA